MNHGMVCWGDETAASTIWALSMSRGQFIAIYASRDVERDDRDPWNLTFAHSLGEPAVLDPKGYGQNPNTRHPTGEVARYEPQYDEQFREMVQSHRGFVAVVPVSVGDDEALRLWCEWNSASLQLCKRIHERYARVPRRWRPHRPNTQPEAPHDKRTSGTYRLRDVIRPIVLNDGWALFLGFYRYPAAAFLSNDRNEVEAVSAAVVAENQDCLIEAW